jgi:OmpR-family two-component system manganese-sensing sensor histidine kinase
LPTLRHFGAYTAVLGIAFGIAAVIVHLMLAREYRNAASMRLTILANSGAEAVENLKPHESVDDALAEIVGSTDEGLIWFDARGKRVGAAGNTNSTGALVKRITIHEDEIDGSIQAMIARDPARKALSDLDRDLAISTAVVMIAGGIVITVISKRSTVRIESLYRGVQQFTADAAHELRTPLAVITSNAESLERESAWDRGSEQRLANIRQAAAQMRTLMDGLLVLARADEDASLDLHAIDLAACVGAVVGDCEVLAAARNLRLSLYASAHQTVYGRPEQIARIVANLVENALRYTPPGGAIDVTCRSERNAAVVEVRDSGIGIVPDNLARVFDRFWRAPESRATEGSGLGLPIAQSLARSHGGEITVASAPGRGSTFTLRLPLRPKRSSEPYTFS